MLSRILNMLCIRYITYSGLFLGRLRILRTRSVSAGSILRRWGRRQGLSPGGCTTSTDLLTTRFWGRCRRGIWIERLRVRDPMWLVRRICSWRRRHEYDFWRTTDRWMIRKLLHTRFKEEGGWFESQWWWSVLATKLKIDGIVVRTIWYVPTVAEMIAARWCDVNVLFWRRSTS